MEITHWPSFYPSTVSLRSQFHCFNVPNFMFFKVLFPNSWAYKSAIYTSPIISDKDECGNRGSNLNCGSQPHRIQYFMLTDITALMRTFILCVPYFIRFMTVGHNVILLFILRCIRILNFIFRAVRVWFCLRVISFCG